MERAIAIPGNFDTVVLGTFGEAAEFAELILATFLFPLSKRSRVQNFRLSLLA
jgi:hypothetical protein